MKCLTLGARVRRIVEESGLSPARIAELSGIHPDTVREWASGLRAPQRRTLLRLAAALEAQGGPRMQRLAEEVRQIAKERGRRPPRRYGGL